MRITVGELRRVIREEVQRALSETGGKNFSTNLKAVENLERNLTQASQALYEKKYVTLQTLLMDLTENFPLDTRDKARVDSAVKTASSLDSGKLDTEAVMTAEEGISSLLNDLMLKFLPERAAEITAKWD